MSLQLFTYCASKIIGFHPAVKCQRLKNANQEGTATIILIEVHSTAIAKGCKEEKDVNGYKTFSKLFKLSLLFF